LTQIDLEGTYDLHVHTAPDVLVRKINDIEAAQQAKNAGMAGLLLKNHHTCTAPRAQIVEKVVPGISVVGALVLDYSVGGINLFAVEAALKMGAREIFMPTKSASNHRNKEGKLGGISILDKEGEKLISKIKDILDMVYQYKAILGTGHLSKLEIRLIVGQAKKQKIRKILVTHPESFLVDLTGEEQKDLADKGVYFERCYLSALSSVMKMPLERIASEIRIVGAERSILTTDLGQPDHPFPVEGLYAFINGLMNLGIKKNEIEIMTQENPRSLLD